MSASTTTNGSAVASADTTKRKPAAPRVSAEARAHMERFHADVVDEVARAVAESPLVVVGMAQNPHVRNVRKALTKANIEFRYLEYGSYFSKWRERLAIKIWSGWPTFPQVFVRGELLGGEDSTVKALETGTLKERLARG